MNRLQPVSFNTMQSILALLQSETEMKNKQQKPIHHILAVAKNLSQEINRWEQIQLAIETRFAAGKGKVGNQQY